MIWVILALAVYVLQIVTIWIVEFRRPAKAIAWLSIAIALPLIGFVIYYFIAREYRQRSRIRLRSRQAIEEIGRHPTPPLSCLQSVERFGNPLMRRESRLFGLLQSFPDSEITERNDTLVIASTQEFYRLMMEDIEKAKHHIHMVYYIWNKDQWGTRFKDALVRKALEGVEVRIIYDGIGAYSTPSSFWEELRAAGVRVHCFLPALIAFFDKRINYRNHRKITIVDGRFGYIGGANIGDEYTGGDPRLGYWRDTSVRLEGDAVYQLQRAFAKDWIFVGGSRLGESKELYPEHNVDHREAVQIVPSGPDTAWDTILEMFFAAFASAKERILVTTPYFIPDQSLIMALKTAALSGVDVRLLIPGIADSKLTLWATMSYIEEMLEAGVRVYRYQKGFIHAKTVVVDRYFATTGTANLDLRSFFSNFEINAAFFEAGTVERFAEDVFADLAESEEIRTSAFKSRGRAERAKEGIGRVLSPLL
ncbi:cardiolipin synthase [Paenibacillus sp. TRM 82003]|nr:cardiolipin synthase [Paenibacillus sp. TRM 82003]